MQLITGKVYQIIPSYLKSDLPLECDLVRYTEAQKIRGKSPIYIGSTFASLKRRFRDHKQFYKQSKQGKYKRYCSVFDIFDKFNPVECEIVLIKEYQVLDTNHLRVYETLWAKKLKSMNKYEPLSFQSLCKKYYQKLKAKQYYEKHREEKKLKNRLYGIEHREEINRRKSIPILCEVCKTKMRKDSRIRHNKTKKHLKNLEK